MLRLSPWVSPTRLLEVRTMASSSVSSARSPTHDAVDDAAPWTDADVGCELRVMSHVSVRALSESKMRATLMWMRRVSMLSSRCCGGPYTTLLGLGDPGGKQVCI